VRIWKQNNKSGFLLFFGLTLSIWGAGLFLLAKARRMN